MKKKLAIITSGGGMKCAWELGAILCLYKQFNITSPDILIAASGSAGTGSYYIAQQYDSMRNIWGNLLPTKKFVDYRRFWKIIDIDYLIDEVFSKQDILDVEKIYTSSTHYLIPALHAQTADVVYFSNKDRINILEAMRATMAIPLAFKINPHVRIDNQPYCDSMLTTAPQTHISKAVELGAQKILVIDILDKKRNILQYYLFTLWVFFHSRLFKRNYSRRLQQTGTYILPSDVEIFTLRSTHPIPVRTMLDNKQSHIKATIELGYQETLQNKSLAKFLLS